MQSCSFSNWLWRKNYQCRWLLKAPSKYIVSLMPSWCFLPHGACFRLHINKSRCQEYRKAPFRSSQSFTPLVGFCFLGFSFWFIEYRNSSKLFDEKQKCCIHSCLGFFDIRLPISISVTALFTFRQAGFQLAVSCQTCWIMQLQSLSFFGKGSRICSLSFAGDHGSLIMITHCWSMAMINQYYLHSIICATQDIPRQTIIGQSLTINQRNVMFVSFFAESLQFQKLPWFHSLEESEEVLEAGCVFLAVIATHTTHINPRSSRQHHRQCVLLHSFYPWRSRWFDPCGPFLEALQTMLLGEKRRDARNQVIETWSLKETR